MIEVQELSAALPAGYSVTTPYGATDNALLVVTDILKAFQTVQAAYNVGQTAPGADIGSLTVGVGATQTVFYPPNQTSVSVEVRPRVYTFTAREKVSVDDIIPVFI